MKIHFLKLTQISILTIVSCYALVVLKERSETFYASQSSETNSLKNDSFLLLKLHLVSVEKYNFNSYVLRGFGFSRCNPRYLNKEVAHLFVVFNNTMLPGMIKTVGGKCPWAWSPKCQWNTYMIEFDLLPSMIQDLTNVVLLNTVTETSSVIPVTQPTNVKEEELMVCVPPLYWYNNFLQLFLFVEMWKQEGASKLIFYYHSVSTDVMNLLEFYQNEGTIHLVPYHSLPKNNLLDPNDSVYRYGHLLAINDCLQRRKSKLATVVDVDEFLYINKTKYGTLLNFVNQKFENYTTLGSLLFNHKALRIDSNNADTSFNFLRNSLVTKKSGPTKYIIKPSRAEAVNSHTVTHLYSPYKQSVLSGTEGYLLHSRSSWAYSGKYTNSTSVDLASSEQIVNMRSRYKIITNYINYQKPFKFETNVLNKFLECLKTWRSGDGCKVPDRLCTKYIINLDRWVFSDDLKDSSNHFVIT
uniref:Glycosyltransferase family 92 protein n=1 Tax=Rhabditophanes sp. KR3021 TaxID=114890 RepID=A0AC35U3I5_9BILA